MRVAVVSMVELMGLLTMMLLMGWGGLFGRPNSCIAWVVSSAFTHILLYTQHSDSKEDIPSIQHSNPLLIPKLLLNTHHNHLLPRLLDSLRLSTQHPRRLRNLLSHPQRIHLSPFPARPAHFTPRPHAPRKRRLWVIRDISAVRPELSFLKCRREVYQVVAGGEGGSGGGRRGVVREGRGVWVEGGAVEGESEELELVCVENLRATLRTEGLEAREE